VSTIAETEGEGSSLSFNKVNISDFPVTLLFDTYEKQSDVREKIEKITSLVMPSVEGKETKQPHICLFSWGKFIYKGIIYKHDQKFTLFLPNGIPVRAELTITFKSVVTTEEDAKFKGKDACRKLWTVKSGDRLDLIADKALKDVSLWRKIADENHIVNPLDFPNDDDIGRILIIPD
ncbi:MAG: peptidoglycan-binding protein LysM, partial [Euryarchaeota archaeon]|nr:peptidoglycan-binding protein LysM [Euryarchaeota archaeon]